MKFTHTYQRDTKKHYSTSIAAVCTTLLFCCWALPATVVLVHAASASRTSARSCSCRGEVFMLAVVVKITEVYYRRRREEDWVFYMPQREKDLSLSHPPFHPTFAVWMRWGAVAHGALEVATPLCICSSSSSR